MTTSELSASFPSYTLHAAGCQIQGARERQEDTLWLQSGDTESQVSRALLLMADGMGGMGDGQAASQTAIKAYAAAWKKNEQAPLTQILHAANAVLGAEKEKDAISAQAGTTLVAAEFSPEGCRWQHIGDSYLLLFREGKLTRLNTPMTMQWWRDEMRRRGESVTAEEAAADGQVLYAALCGTEIRASEEQATAACIPGSRYILASDGIAALVEDGTLQKILNAPEVAQAAPGKVAKFILKTQEKRQLAHQDNATVIVADITPPSPDCSHSHRSTPMIDFSHVSELGDRETQQDCEGCWVSEHSALAVVADGAGSYHNSEEASATVVAYLQQSWKQALCYGMDPAAAGQLISDAVLKAHRHILDAVGGDAGRCGKSALVALYTHKGAYTVVHVGDCRAYLGRGKRWKQLTKDDSMLQRLLDSGKITPEEAKDSPEQSVLLQAVGASVAPKPHISSGTFRSTDGFLLCCDGFWNQLPEDKWPLFASCAPQNRQHFLKTLVGSAVENAAGDSDNVSVIWQHPVVYRTPAQALARTTVLWTAITALVTAIAALSYLLYTETTTEVPTETGGTTGQNPEEEKQGDKKNEEEKQDDKKNEEEKQGDKKNEEEKQGDKKPDEPQKPKDKGQAENDSPKGGLLGEPTSPIDTGATDINVGKVQR